MSRPRVWISLCLVVSLTVHIQLCFAVEAQLDVTPVAFLPGVTGSVQMACRPPATEDISRVMTLQLSRMHDQSPGEDVVVTFITTGAPVVEEFGRTLRVSASGTYDTRHPKAASLIVTLPKPTEAADGQYTCSVEALDSQGLLYRYISHTSLVSLAKNGTVPVFYQAILQEMRNDLDNLTTDLSMVQQLQADLTNGDTTEQAQLTTITTNGAKITDTVNEVHNLVIAADQKVNTMEAEIARLRDITPETPVNFFAYLSSYYVAPSNNENVVFNSVPETSHTTSYSATTGVFTVPINGTYFFRTGITSNTSPTYVSIVVNNNSMASTFGFDDYVLNDAAACLLVEVVKGDQVRVVKMLGSNVFGLPQLLRYNGSPQLLHGLLAVVAIMTIL